MRRARYCVENKGLNDISGNGNIEYPVMGNPIEGASRLFGVPSMCGVLECSDSLSRLIVEANLQSNSIEISVKRNHFRSKFRNLQLFCKLFHLEMKQKRSKLKEANSFDLQYFSSLSPDISSKSPVFSSKSPVRTLVKRQVHLQISPVNLQLVSLVKRQANLQISPVNLQ